MKESARAALTYIRTNAPTLGLDTASFEKRSVHVHVPEGAIPKDGPSAGVTLAASLASAFTSRPVLPGRAMTGEITLTGRVLAVGGVKEKILAAHRNKILLVLLPEGNRKDLDELPKEVVEAMTFVFVASVAEAFEHLFSPEADSAQAKKPTDANPEGEETVKETR